MDGPEETESSRLMIESDDEAPEGGSSKEQKPTPVSPETSEPKPEPKPESKPESKPEPEPQPELDLPKEVIDDAGGDDDGEIEEGKVAGEMGDSSSSSSSSGGVTGRLPIIASLAFAASCSFIICSLAIVFPNIAREALRDPAVSVNVSLLFTSIISTGLLCLIPLSNGLSAKFGRRRTITTLFASFMMVGVFLFIGGAARNSSNTIGAAFTFIFSCATVCLFSLKMLLTEFVDSSALKFGKMAFVGLLIGGWILASFAVLVGANFLTISIIDLVVLLIGLIFTMIFAKESQVISSSQSQSKSFSERMQEVKAFFSAFRFSISRNSDFLLFLVQHFFFGTTIPSILLVPFVLKDVAGETNGVRGSSGFFLILGVLTVITFFVTPLISNHVQNDRFVLASGFIVHLFFLGSLMAFKLVGFFMLSAVLGGLGFGILLFSSFAVRDKIIPLKRLSVQYGAEIRTFIYAGVALGSFFGMTLDAFEISHENSSTRDEAKVEPRFSRGGYYLVFGTSMAFALLSIVISFFIDTERSDRYQVLNEASDPGAERHVIEVDPDEDQGEGAGQSGEGDEEEDGGHMFFKKSDYGQL